jgi:hypothetical protein
LFQQVREEETMGTSDVPPEKKPVPPRERSDEKKAASERGQPHPDDPWFQPESGVPRPEVDPTTQGPLSDDD